MADLRPSAPWWALPVPLVVAGTMGSNHSGGGPEVVRAGFVGLLASAAIPGALRWPRTAVLVNGFVVGAYFAAGLANGPIFLTVPLTALAASQRARPRALLPVIGVALVAILAGLGVRVATDNASFLVASWQSVGLAALSFGACSVGWWWVDRRESREERARHAATEERLRMAQELHDGVGHGLAVIAMQAGVALHVLDRDPAQARLSLEAIRDTSRESLDALRTELARISATAPGPRRPAPGLTELEPLVARIRSGGLDVVLRLDPRDVEGLPDDVGRVVYSVVQESLTNVLRHAHASVATVTLRRVGGPSGERVEVTIVDDGRGVGPGAKAVAGTGAAGMGIAGMRGRVEGLGGELTAGPTTGPATGPVAGPVTGSAEHGFRVSATLPVRTAGP